MTLLPPTWLSPRRVRAPWLFLIVVLLMLTASSLRAQQANFTADVTAGCLPLTVHFTDISTGTITGWDWDLGNGDHSTEKNPGAIFTAAGVYTVRLTVTGSSGSDTEIKTGYITVYQLPIVNFSFDKTAGCSPLLVKFTNQSQAGSGIITEYNWVFGDGSTSTEANPSYTYQISGPKNISLRVKNQYGCQQNAFKAAAITVQGPTTDFTVSNTAFCQVPALAQFTNQSTGDAPLTYSWNFGDGKTSTQKDPSNTYNQAGVFNSALTVRDKNGCTSIKTQQIRTGSEGGITVTPSRNKICTGESVSFSVTAETAVLSYNWNFDDNGAGSTDPNPPAVTYTQAGTRTVVLRARLLGKSCESVVSIPIVVEAYPEPTFGYTVDCLQKVTFTNTSIGASRVRWEIDGSYASDQNSFTRTYQGPGPHFVRLTAYNSLGCSKVYEANIDVNGKPTASFTPDKEQDCDDNLSLSGCAPFTVNFKNTSTGNGSLTSKWTFGDGGTATTKDASHTYAAGTYTVTLEVKNALGCSAIKTAKVTVSNITPVAKFVVVKPVACAREDVRFTDQSTNATFWCWDFGDGGTSTVQSPTHSYEKPGVYTVTLKAKNGGCSSTYTITQAVTVNDPFVDFEITKGCIDTYQIQLVNKSTNYTSLSWDFGDGQTATGNTGSHRYTATGNYTVVLIGRNSATQCAVRIEKPVTIYNVQADFTVDNVTPCKDAPVTFKDNSTDAAAWRWVFGNNIPNTNPSPVTSYSQAGSYSATLIVTDRDGCTSSKSVNIDVLDLTGNFNPVATSTCTDLKVKFTDLSSASPAITNWLWDFGDGSVKETVQNPEHTYTTPNTSYAVSLTLTNAKGTCTFIRYNAVNFTTPQGDFAVAKRGNCLNQAIQFGNLSRNAAIYNWDFGNGQTSTSLNPITSYSVTGEYTVTLTVKDVYGCEQTFPKPQYISITQPEAKFTATDIYADCPVLTTNFASQSIAVGAQQLDWSFGDGQRAANNPTPSNTYGRPGQYDVSLTVTDLNGCKDTMTKPSLVYVGGPTGTFAVQGDGPFCVNDSTIFIAHTINAVRHEWAFGDGILRDQPEMNAGHRYKGTGSYNVVLKLYDANGCPFFADDNVVVNIMDTTKIDVSSPACVFTDIASPITATAEQDNMEYSWIVDGVPAGTGQQVPITINSPGIHTIVLNGVNTAGCVSTMVYEVPVQGDVSLVPNVFTPEGMDDLNSTFEILGLEHSTWDLTVYNRWGKEVYQQRAYQNQWNGHGLAVGVYYYLLQNAVCPEHKYKGPVSIRR